MIEINDSYESYRGVVPDRFQREAMRAIDEDKNVVVAAPTGAGKTLIAHYAIDAAHAAAAPEIYTKVRSDYPDMPVLMMTAFHYDKDHIIKRSRVEGLEGVIFKKPVDPERLRHAIAESVGRG